MAKAQKPGDTIRFILAAASLMFNIPILMESCSYTIIYLFSFINGLYMACRSWLLKTLLGIIFLIYIKTLK